MVSFDQIVNTQVVVPFLSQGLTTGKTTFSMTALRDGVSTTVTPVYAEIGNGLYTLSFTPTVTGRYTFFIEGSIQISVNAVSRDVWSYLKNIEDEAVGSWTWDKVGGTLTMVRQDGTTLGTFTVSDTVNSASRERN
jgi:hypothetical protein